MGEPILIYGKSGCGKSRSLINFEEDEILFVNVASKRLPFKKKFKYELKSDNADVIIKQLAKMPCKVAVIDDAGYIMTGRFMRGHSAGKTGSGVYALYNDIADDFWKIITTIKSLPDDVNVFVIMHEDTDDFGNVKTRTIGKLLDKTVCLEGLFTVCLHALVNDGKYVFKTQADEKDIAKSPEGLFESIEIDNDLKKVDTAIREYWG